VPPYYLDPLEDPRYPAFIERHPNSSIFHTQAWLQALQATYAFEPAAITTSSPGADLSNAIVFCRVNSWLTGRRLVSLPFSDHCAPLLDTAADLEALLQSLRDMQRKEGWKYVELRPLVRLPDIAPSGFSPSQTFYFHSLDLRPTLEQLMAAFHKNCVQRKIRRAERDGLNYEEGSSERLLRIFYALQMQTRRRQKLPPQPYAWFKNLAACLGETMKIRLASLGNTPVAAILTLRHKDQMVYKYGCSDDRYSQHGGTQLVFWRAIQEAKSAGCVSLDMGRSDCDNQGLVDFKDRWRAAKSTLTYLRCPTSPSTVQQSWNSPIAGSLLARLPDRALSLMGTLFYRHIA
jgi:hypothetical protein